MKLLIMGILLLGSYSLFADGVIMDMSTGDLSTYTTNGDTTTIMDRNTGNLSIVYPNR